MIRLPEEAIFKIIDFAVSLGAKFERVNNGNEAKFISQNQAFRMYGRAAVERWISTGLVKRCKDQCGRNSSIRLSVVELDSAAFKSNIFSNLSPLSKAELRESINQ